ncbi:TetR/AcrR family transcriptional regulator [Alteribacter populi]|uniref:TetR/AcrR family transcriptional regulator n=1 Tax=Alteribacter populi TaxID=2011011 RepID=UPI0012FD78B4|nr:TetR/AcrR family transcriptional regulator [Alteribacter populi]
MPASTVDRIKEEALLLFANEGYDGASLSKIAKRVGIRKSSLYNHFANKEDLFMVLVEDVYKRFAEELRGVVQNQHSHSTKNVLYSAFIKTTDFIRYDAIGKFYFHYAMFPPADLKEAVRELFLSFEEELDDVFLPIFRHGIEAGEIENRDAKMFLNAYYCFLDGISTQMFYYPEETINARKQHVWTVFWQGIKKR